MDDGRQRDSVLGSLPAPIPNPEAYPPNYADGWNACSEVAYASVRAELARAASKAVAGLGEGEVMKDTDGGF